MKSVTISKEKEEGNRHAELTKSKSDKNRSDSSKIGEESAPHKHALWCIHNKYYDLTKFIDHHPGGREVLLRTQGERDLSAMFETYHAFSDIESIKKSLQKYEVAHDPIDQKNGAGGKNVLYDFTKYHELVAEVKKIYPNRASIKATPFWVLINIINFALYVIFYYYMVKERVLWKSCVLGALASTAWMSNVFNMLHDGSHFGISIYPFVNIFANNLWNSWSLWNGKIWFLHHVYYHHSFTSLENLDPDVYHLRPFARKTKSDPTIAPFFLKHQQHLIAIFLFLLPGQFYGQGISYVIASFRRKLWKMAFPKMRMYQPLDILVSSISLAVMIYGFMYCVSILPMLCFMVGNNLFYALNIIPDHDTYESNIENHYIGNDWLVQQIRNSANFVNDNKFWTHAFGGINYQIEHHLFPNMSNAHLPTIKPIVMKFCEANHIPYVHHKTMYSAMNSFFKMMRYNSST